MGSHPGSYVEGPQGRETSQETLATSQARVTAVGARVVAVEVVRSRGFWMCQQDSLMGCMLYVCDRKERFLAQAARRMQFAIYEMRDVGRKAGLQWEGQELIFGHVNFEMPIRYQPYMAQVEI